MDSMPGYDYFDSEYFNDGQSKGTVYSNYVAATHSSQIYLEIADAITQVFRPRRALEIGCATGIIVRLLIERGIDGHGIDVSQWAINNREHPNVVLAGAEALPFPDGHFDLVYSVHALEHIPEALAATAFQEIRRVCPTGPQWHMLPIIGLGPYKGDRATIIAGLKKDPTHNLLQDERWWLEQFEEVGLSDSGMALSLRTEGATLDLSVSQIMVSGTPIEYESRRRLRAWNSRVLADYHERAHRSGSFLSLDGTWKDLRVALPQVPYADDLEIELDLIATAPMSLRAAFLGRDNTIEVDQWFDLPEGRTKLLLGPNLILRRGLAEDAEFDTLLIGGQAEGIVVASVARIRANKKTVFGT